MEGLNPDNIGNSVVVYCPQCGAQCLYGTSKPEFGWELCVDHPCNPEEWDLSRT